MPLRTSSALRAELGLKEDEYERIRQILAAGRPSPSSRCTRSCGASTARTSRARCTCASSARRPRRPDRMLAGIGENAGVVDDQRQARGHLQGRVAQPSVLRRALSGRGDRRRRHRARHPRDGRPAGRGDGPAALRRGRPPRHRAGPARRRRGHRRLRQLPRPAQHRRRGGLRPVATRATRWSTRSAWACCRSTGLQRKAAAGPGNIVVLMGAKTGRDGIGGVSVLASATFDDELASSAGPSVQVGDPFIEKLLIESCLELYDAQADRRRPGPRRRRPDLRADRDRRLGRAPAWTSSWRRCTCARPRWSRTRCWPASRRSACSSSSSRPSWTRCSASPRCGASSPPRSASSPTPAGSASPGTARPWSTCRRAASPTTARSTPGRCASPRDLILLQADRAETLPRPHHDLQLKDTLLTLVASPNLCDKTWVTEQYDRYVLRQHDPGPAGGLRHHPHRRGDRSRRRAVGGRQLALHPPRPVRGREARPRRGLPQRGRHRRRAGRRDRLPQLRLAGGPGGDVAVRRGRPRARRRLPGAGHPGHRRQRQLLQPDRRGGDPPDPDRGRARRPRRRGAAHPDGLQPRPATCSSCSARPARSCPARSGRGSRTSTSAAARRRSTSRGSRPSPASWQRGRETRPGPLGARPVRRRPRAGAGRVGAAQGLGRDGHPARGRSTRSSSLFSESAGRVLVTVPLGHRQAFEALVAEARDPVHAARRHRRHGRSW